MALTDWTLLTDGTTKKLLTNTYAPSGDYAVKMQQASGSANYVSYMTNNTIQTIDNCRVEAICTIKPDYVESPDYYTPATWNITTTSTYYSVSGNAITRLPPGGATWQNSAYDGTHPINRIGVGAKIQYTSLWNSIFFGLHTSASAVAYTAMPLSIQIIGAGNGAYLRVLETNVSKYGTAAATYGQFWDGWFVTQNDIISIEINSSMTYDYKVNGIVFYTSAVTWNGVASLYAHFFGGQGGDAAQVWVDSGSNTKTDRAVYPVLFNRLQSASQSADCYAMKYNQSKAISIVKGSVNTATPTTLVSAAVGLTAGSNLLSFETTTVPTAVYNVVRQKSITIFDNAMTTGAAGTPTANRRGQAIGTPLITTGKFSTALYLDGFSGVYLLNSDLACTTVRTVEMWIYPKRVDKGCLFRRDTTYTDFGLYFQNGRLIPITACSSGVAPTSMQLGWVISTTKFSPNIWYHITCVMPVSNPLAYLYVNGVYDCVTGALSYATMTNGSGNYTIGTGRDGTTGILGNNYVGLIDSFQYVEAAMTTAEIAARYAAQVGGTPPTVYNGTTTKVLYKFDDAYTETIILNHMDTDSPILQPGYTGIGIHNPQAVSSSAYFDSTKIYTQT